MKVKCDYCGKLAIQFYDFIWMNPYKFKAVCKYHSIGPGKLNNDRFKFLTKKEYLIAKVLES
jgi:hypothetical protein